MTDTTTLPPGSPGDPGGAGGSGGPDGSCESSGVAGSLGLGGSTLLGELRDLDASGVLDLVVDRRRAADYAEAELLAGVVHLVDLYPVTDPDTDDAAYIAVNDRPLIAAEAGPAYRVPIAGVGCPQVREDGVVALAAALGMTYRRALSLVGESLELCYRLPRLWNLVQTGQLQAWKARRVARHTTALSVAAVAFVDGHLSVSGIRNHVPVNLGPILTLALNRCDPEVAEGREEAALAARHVSFDYSTTTDSGATADLNARLDILDALDLDHQITTLAAEMARLGDTSPLGVRRAHALGILANPQHTLNIFGTTTSGTGTGTGTASSGTDTPEVVAGSDTGSEDADGTDGTDGGDIDSDAESDAAGGADGGSGSGTGAGRATGTDTGDSTATGPASADQAGSTAPDATVPASAGPARSAAGSAGLAGFAGWPGLAEAAVRGGIGGRLNATGATLYLHITAADLATALGHPHAEDSDGPESGGVRVEKLNSITLGLLRQWLQRTHSVTIRPVLDMTCTDAVDQHDPPDWMREAVILRDQHCVFPGCGIDARDCDQDHIVPYQPMDSGGPPGQTHLANLACLCRRHHRMKTSRIWSYQRLPDHSYQWTSPHGHVYTTNPGHPPGPQPGTRPDRR